MNRLDFVASVLFFVLFLHYYFRLRTKTGKLPLPPGPPKLPILGNLLHMPKVQECETYHKWCNELDSDIIHLDVAGTSIVVLDTIEAATELLDKRSSLYSSRPRMPMLLELCEYNFNFGFLPYGDAWRERRRVFHQSFHPTAAKGFQPHEIKATHGLLRRLLDEPGTDLITHLQHLAGETIMSMVYGIDVLRENDPYVKVVKEGNHPVRLSAIPGAFLVDTIPALKYIPDWMPFAGFKRTAREWRKLCHSLLDVPFNAAKQKIESGEVRHSFISHSLANIAENMDVAHQEEVIKFAAGTIYTAGSDTTLSSIASCVLGLLANPEIQTRAHEEIDRVLGPGRLPQFEDLDSLPYITAIFKESLRWREVAPMGVPHLLDADDEYKGYRLPAGSIIIPNIWAILHNEKVYPDPFTFNPDRFFKDGRLDRNAQDPADTAFGFGRRICPGRHMATSAVWIAIVSIIAVFDIRKAVDENGKVVEPSYEYCTGLVRYPLPFECLITPRSGEAVALIRETEDYY